MATQITANLPTLNFPREVDYPTQEDWAAFSAAAELNFGILGGDWSTQMQLWKDQSNAMSIELNNNADIAQAVANYQGDWLSQGYTLGQTVSVSGIYYICKLTHTSGENPTTGGSLYWNLALGNWSLKIDTNMSGYISKTTPADTDLIPLSDSASSFGIKKLSWANLKANLNTGFKNLIINGRKQVNQSGLTTTDNSYNYDNHYKVGNNWFMFIDGKNIISGESYTLSWEGVATAGYYIGTAGALTINAQTFTPIINGTTITPTITSSQKLWIKFSSDASGSTYNKVQFEPGTTPTPYEQRLYMFELDLVQSYYETSYSIGVALRTNTGVGSIMLPPYTPSNDASGYNVDFKKVKRAIPIIGLYSISGTVARVTIVDSGLETTVATTPQNASTNGFGGWVAIGTGNAPSASRTAFHYYADARPY